MKRSFTLSNTKGEAKGKGMIKSSQKIVDITVSKLTKDDPLCDGRGCLCFQIPREKKSTE